MGPAAVRLGAGLVAMGVFWVAPDAPAKPRGASASTAAQPVELARLRYRQGVEAYQGKRYRESIDYFLEADRLAPNAALSFNIARAYENIDDAAASLRWYRDYLRRAPEAQDHTEVEAVVKGLEKRLAEKGVQQVTIQSDPSGADVTVDGRSVGVTPWTGELAPGRHELGLEHDGYAPTERSFDLPPDHATEVAVTLDVASVKEAPAPSPPKAPENVAPPVRSDERGPGGSGTLGTFRTLGWIGIGAGGAALGGSLVFEILRRSAESDAKSDHTQVGYADHLDTMQGRQTAARVLLGTGLVLGVAGGTLLWLGRDRQGTGVGVACAPGGCLSTVRGRF